MAHGKGKFTYDDGFYEGQFEFGRKHGVGKYSFKDGSVYDGDWYNN